MRFLCFFEKITKTCFFLKKKRISKKQEGWNFLKKMGFLNLDYLSIIFCDFPLIA